MGNLIVKTINTHNLKLELKFLNFCQVNIFCIFNKTCRSDFSLSNSSKIIKIGLMDRKILFSLSLRSYEISLQICKENFI